MYKRPQHENPEIMKEIIESGADMADGLLEGACQAARTQGGMTANVLQVEYAGLYILAMIALNTVMQKKGTLEEYKAWMNAEFDKIYTERFNSPDLEAVGVGGESLMSKTSMEIN